MARAGMRPEPPVPVFKRLSAKLSRQGSYVIRNITGDFTNERLNEIQYGSLRPWAIFQRITMSHPLAATSPSIGTPRLRARLSNRIAVCLAVLALAVTWALNWLTPMSSDDFSYANKGVSWNAVWRHYTGWSGRLVADTLSSWMLNLEQTWMVATLNTMAVTGLSLILAALGARLAGRTLRPQLVLLVFFLYWLANPDLGQTTFWVVGAANYLWPNVFNFGFALAYLWRLRQGSTPLWLAAALALLALPAGCSNENTGIVTWCLLAWLTYRHARQRPLGAWPLIWLLCMAAGIAILLLAPGNQIRAEAFDHWYSQPALGRALDHFSRRFPDAMLRYAGVFLILGAWRLHAGPPSPKTRRAMVLLVGASCLANAILVLAPNIPKRALNGGFMYLLVALSLYGHDLQDKAALWRRGLSVTLAACALAWLLSGGLMLRAYHGAWQQDQVRRAIIADGLERKLARIEIPQYHFRRTLRSRDRFDTFFDGSALANYYNSTATIVEYPVKEHYDLHKPPQRLE